MQREHARICACFFIIVMAFLPALFAVNCSQYGGCKICDKKIMCETTSSWKEIRSGFEWGADLNCTDGATRRATCANGGYSGGTIILRMFYNCYLNGTLVASSDTHSSGTCTSFEAYFAKEFCVNYFSFAWGSSPLTCTPGSALSVEATVVGATESCPDGFFAVNACGTIPATTTDSVGSKVNFCEPSMVW
jgi:hypothetical protein